MKNRLIMKLDVYISKYLHFLFLFFAAIEGDSMSPDFIPCEPGVSSLYP